jgi:Zn-dependent protease with chaperone function
MALINDFGFYNIFLQGIFKSSCLSVFGIVLVGDFKINGNVVFSIHCTLNIVGYFSNIVAHNHLSAIGIGSGNLNGICFIELLFITFVLLFVLLMFIDFIVDFLLFLLG